MSLSCSHSNITCVPTAEVVNVNEQLCPSPESNVVIMDTPRIYTSMSPWIGLYGQTQATKTLASTRAVPITVRRGDAGHSLVQNQRVVTTPAHTSSLVSNMGFGNAPTRGTYVQALSGESFVTPRVAHSATAPLGTTGYDVALRAQASTHNSSYGMVPLLNPARSYGSILSSPVPLPKNA